jgi:hypothetical protein
MDQLRSQSEDATMSFDIGNIFSTFTQAASLLDPTLAGAAILTKVIDAAQDGRITPSELLNLSTANANSNFDAGSAFRALSQSLTGGRV